MKYVILQGDSMAGVPHQDLGGRTPLQAAATPNMDFLARHGELGLATIRTEGVARGSEVSHLAILGYDPHTHQVGPAPFEATSLGIALGKTDVAFHCGLVTLRADHPRGRGAGTAEVKKLGPNVILDDDTAGGIDTEEGRELLDAINEQLGSEAILFCPGRGHRHVMVWVGGKARATCFGPHEVVGRPVGEFLPTGDGAQVLRQLMEASLVILRDHPVNERRREMGLKPANCMWLWGQGRAPQWPSLRERYQITGSVISQTDLVRGIGICAGLAAIGPDRLPGPEGTDLVGWGEAALRELRSKDLVYVHVEMPAEVARGDDPKAKMKVVEEFDRKTVGTILESLPSLGPHRVLLVCGHPAQLGAPGQVAQGVLWEAPYALYSGPLGSEPANSRGFSEADAKAAQARPRDAAKLMTRLLAHGIG